VKPLPIPPATVTPDNEEHFAALAEERLLLPRCRSCGEVFWYPRHFCPFCGALGVEWIEASGRGTVYSFTVVRRGGLGPYAEAMPYVVAYVELEEGPRVMTNLLDEDVEIGDPVEAVFERSDAAPPMLRFRKTPPT
jgi:uncharacterized OB-fold protein